MPAFISHDVVREDRPDGAILLRTRVPLGPVARNTGAWLHRWAKDAPDRVLLAERSGQGWRELRYDHGLLALAAQYVGVPIVPLAEQYSLVPDAHPRLQYAVEAVRPKMVFADDGAEIGKA